MINLVLWGIVATGILIRFMYVLLMVLRKNNPDNNEDDGSLNNHDMIYFIAGFIMYICIIILGVRSFIA